MSEEDAELSEDAQLAARFGRGVTRHREASGLSMAKLAALAGMSRAYLWRVEQGATLPSLRNVARLAAALEMPASTLVESLDASRVSLANRPYERPDKA